MHALKHANFSRELVYRSILKCFKGKTDRTDVCSLISKQTKGLFTTDEVRMHIKCEGIEFFQPYIESLATDYYIEITRRHVYFEPIITQVIVEESSNKVRELSIQSLKQLIFDYIAVEMLDPVFKNHFGPYQSASIKGRGQRHSKEAIEKWVRSNPEGTRYYIKTDVVDYFHSINHTLLLKMIRKYVYDETLLYLVETILATYGRGLSIGSYLSQYLANLYMNDTYHFLAEQLIKTRRGVTRNLVTYVIVYMDDILVFCKNESDANKVYKKLAKFMYKKKLELHNTIIKEFKYGDYIDIIGFKIYKDHTAIRPRIYKRIRKLVLSKRRYKISLKDAYAISSYNGIRSATNSNNFDSRYKFNELLENSKNKISDFDKSFNLIP